MVPRRHRSLVYKLVVAIPLLWIVLLMFFYNEKKTTVEAVSKGEVAGRKVQAQARVVEAAPGEERELDLEDGNRKKRNRTPEDPIDNDVRDPNGPGELGKPFKIENPDHETKAAIDKGWQVTARIQFRILTQPPHKIHLALVTIGVKYFTNEKEKNNESLAAPFSESAQTEITLNPHIVFG